MNECTANRQGLVQPNLPSLSWIRCLNRFFPFKISLIFSQIIALQIALKKYP